MAAHRDNTQPFSASRLLALLALLAACDGAADAPPRAPAPASATAAAAEVVDVAGLAGGVLERPYVFPPTLHAEIEALDPALDGWPSEALAARAERVLHGLAGVLERGAARDSSWSATFATDDFRVGFGPRVAPRVVRDDGSFRVTRGGLGESADASIDFSRAIDVLLEPFADGTVLRAGFETDRIELVDDTTFRTESFARLSGRTADGASWQQNARWHCAWRTNNQRARMTSLTVVDLEEVVRTAGTGPLLEDCTRAVLGADAMLARIVGRGATDWNASLDKTLGTSIFGHSGLAVGDADGDGRDDVYVCQPGGLPNLLLVQQQDGTVANRAHDAGVDTLDLTRSALWVDLDNDGDQDLVTAGGALLVYENTGELRFQLRFRQAVEAIFSLSAADVDGDTLLDLYACRYAETDNSTPTPYHDANNGPGNVLLRNAGEWSFRDVTEAWGLGENNHRYSFAASWVDHDGDGDLDLYVANDFGRNNLYQNDDGTFRDVAGERGGEDVAAGMSVAWGDYDADGAPDLYVGNMYSAAGGRLSHQDRFRDAASSSFYRRHARGNTLLRNRGDGTYEDATIAAGVALGRWAWASSFLDVDNDGLLDLAVANGYLTGSREGSLCSFFWRHVVGRSPTEAGAGSDAYDAGWTAVNELQRHGWTFAGREPNCLYLNTGDGRFADVSAVAGFDFEDDARALAVTDWDRDGSLDVWLTSRSAPRLRLLRSAQPSERFVAVRLEGLTVNRDAIGARVELVHKATARTNDEAKPRKQVRHLVAGESFLSQSSKWLHFALRDGEAPEHMLVTWPDGTRERFGGLVTGGRYLLVQGTGAARPTSPDGDPPAVALAPGAAATLDEGPDPLVYLAAPVPLVGFAYVDEQGVRRELAADGRPHCVVFWTAMRASSRALLGELTAQAGAAAPALLALCVDRELAPEDASALLDAWDWPHARGFASEQLMTLMDAQRDVIFAQPATMKIPGGLVLDGRNRIVALFNGPVSAERLLDPSLTEALERDERRERATPFAGMWLTPPAGPQVLALVAQLRRFGLVDIARAYLTGMSGAGSLDARQRLADAHELLGRELADRGRFAEAAEELARCLDLDEGRSKVCVELGNALRALGRDADALAYFHQAVLIDPKSGDAHYSVGLMHALAGRLDEASASFALAVSHDPENDLAHFNLAIALANTGDLDAALPHLERALVLRPDYAQASQALGSMRLQRGDGTGAAAVYQSALEFAPGDAQLLFGLGRARLAAGDATGARETLEQLERANADLAGRLAREIEQAP